MTKQQAIQADTASAVILQIPLEMLYISDLNPRKAISEVHIESLAESIERFGLIHNLAGLMDEDGKVGVVAGGCRLRAIQMIAERSDTHPSPRFRSNWPQTPPKPRIGPAPRTRPART